MKNIFLNLLTQTILFGIVIFFIGSCRPTADESAYLDRQALESIWDKATEFSKDSVNSQPGKVKEVDDPIYQWYYDVKSAVAHAELMDAMNLRSDSLFAAAKAFAEKSDHSEALFVIHVIQGDYYFKHGQTSEAIPSFLNASSLLEHINAEAVPHLAHHLNLMGTFFSHLGDYRLALHCLEKGLPHAVPLNHSQIDLYSSMAVYLHHEGRSQEAEVYFSRALDASTQAGDTVRLGYILEKLADVKYHNHRTAEAITDLKESIAIAQRHRENQHALSALVALSEIYVHENQLAEAKETLSLAQAYVLDKPSYLTYKLKIAQLAATLASYEGDKSQELQQLKRATHLQQVLNKREGIEHLQRSHWQWKQEQYSKRLNDDLLREKQQERYLQGAMIGLAVIISFGGVFMLRYKRRIQRRSMLLEKKLRQEKHLMGEELLVLRSSLGQYSSTLQTSEGHIQTLKHKHPKDEGGYMESLESLLDSHLMTDISWFKFKTIFDQMHEGYLEQLKSSYPLLTEGDLRIIALCKLEQGNRRIANVLGISVDGVKKAKQRLKKKLNVATLEELDIPYQN